MSCAPEFSPRESGFTLIELMISLVLGMIVMGSAIAVLASQRGSSRLSRQGADIQAEGRIAVDALARALRGAGDFGCWPVSNPINKLKTATVFSETSGGVEGLDHGGATSSLTAYGKSQLDALHVVSDVVGVTGITDVLTETKTAQVTSSDELTVNPGRQGFAAGDVAVISNCINWTKFEVTAATANATNTQVTLAHAASTPSTTSTGPGGGNAAADLGEIYGVGSSVGKLDTVWWFVGQPEGKPRGLYRLSGMGGTPVLISPRVYDMRVRYDVDTNADGIVDLAGQTATQVRTGGNWAKVRAARVEVLMRSEKSVPTQAVKYTFDSSTPTTPTDRAVYLVLSQNVALRNTQ